VGEFKKKNRNKTSMALGWLHGKNRVGFLRGITRDTNSPLQGNNRILCSLDITVRRWVDTLLEAEDFVQRVERGFVLFSRPVYETHMGEGFDFLSPVLVETPLETQF